jgi:hypothetical protein
MTVCQQRALETSEDTRVRPLWSEPPYRFPVTG